MSEDNFNTDNAGVYIQDKNGKPIFMVKLDGAVFGVVDGIFRQVSVDGELSKCFAVLVGELQEYKAKLQGELAALETKRAIAEGKVEEAYNLFLWQ